MLATQKGLCCRNASFSRSEERLVRRYGERTRYLLWSTVARTGRTMIGRAVRRRIYSGSDTASGDPRRTSAPVGSQIISLQRPLRASSCPYLAKSGEGGADQSSLDVSGPTGALHLPTDPIFHPIVPRHYRRRHEYDIPPRSRLNRLVSEKATNSMSLDQVEHGLGIAYLDI